MSHVKRVIPPYKVISAGDMSGDITGKVTSVTFSDTLTYGIAWTGTSPVGTMKVQGSLDYTETADHTVLDAGTWFDLPLAPAPAVSGATGTLSISLRFHSFPWLRLVYSRSSGTGTMTAWIAGREV